MSSESDAWGIIDDPGVPVSRLREVAEALREEGRTDLVAEMLTAVARSALEGRRPAGECAELAVDVLREHQQFSYARRLLGRARVTDSSERLRQQHALCTYKDLELPARRRLDQALKVLTEGAPLERSTSSETLGIAGAIYKRRWELDAGRADLESARWCYRRGFDREDDDDRWYAGVNAAFVADELAALEDRSLGGADRAEQLRGEADCIRWQIVRGLKGGDCGWDDATLGEAWFGLDELDKARESLAAVATKRKELWRQESSATQLAALARLRGLAEGPANEALDALVGGHAGGLRRASSGKVGLALSGGGFRASLFHIGVLARLAECNVLRHVEVLSCVSGGSILGAAYYLKLKRLLESKPDGEVSDADYVTLVAGLADEFLDGVRRNLRRRIVLNPVDDARMLVTRYSRTDRAGELFEQLFYRPSRNATGAWRMPDLIVKPAGREHGFSLRYENWLRSAKVPNLVLNATTLNTGHPWQFTASWMGEPPAGSEQRVDASRRLRRVYYRDAPDAGDLQHPTLGMAVAASACVPGAFPPIELKRLYDDIDVELVDGGVYDNQGIASLLDADCTVFLVSDASGQLPDDEDPARRATRVLKRSNSVLMKRVRGSQYGDLRDRLRSRTVRGLMMVHLTKGLPAPPRDWSDCQEPWEPQDEARSGETAAAYGIDEGVQRALAALRTDLDAFSDDEAFALMAAGYLMTTRDLADALPDLAEPRRELVRDDWPFAAVCAEMTSDAASRLAESLRSGEDRFFRRSRKVLRQVRALPAKLRREAMRNE